MSTFIYLDSEFRYDKTEPATFFNINTDQTTNWPLNPRTINNVFPTMYNQQLDFLSKIDLLDLFILYDGKPSEPFLKIVFYNIEYNDSFLVNTLDDQNDIKFIARQYKDYGNGWFRYTSEMCQTMRFKRKGTFVLKIIDKDNKILDIGSNGRLTVLFSVDPFVLSYNPNQTRNI